VLRPCRCSAALTNLCRSHSRAGTSRHPRPLSKPRDPATPGGLVRADFVVTGACVGRRGRGRSFRGLWGGSPQAWLCPGAGSLGVQGHPCPPDSALGLSSRQTTPLCHRVPPRPPPPCSLSVLASLCPCSPSASPCVPRYVPPRLAVPSLAVVPRSPPCQRARRRPLCVWVLLCLGGFARGGGGGAGPPG